MQFDLLSSLKKGFDKLRSNPQLNYTIVVAVLILFAFIFIANRFVTIAQDAQDRLVNVRLGALQDSLVEFVPDYFDEESGPMSLEKIISRISTRNATIKDFRIIKFNLNEPVIVASLDKNEIGNVDSDNSRFYEVARSDPESSFTFENFSDLERIYKTIRIVTDQSGMPIGAIITEQSLSEADLKISENIHNSVLIFIAIVVLIMFLFFRHARIIDYVSLYKRLQEVDELKDDFISMASHELRTPLTVIRGYAENLSEENNLSEESKKSASRIDLAAKQLDELVADMLDVSRIEQGRIEIKSETADPIPVVDDIVGNFVSLASNKGLEIKFNHILTGGEKINIDPSRFKQIMTNLIGNAIKYTPKGEINVKMRSENGKLFIRVSDTGLGMSSEEQKNLFHKFYRVSNKETKEIRGTGLGLWITKQFVELMNGKISVESIKGVGTHFIVEFPLVNNN